MNIQIEKIYNNIKKLMIENIQFFNYFLFPYILNLFDIT